MKAIKLSIANPDTLDHLDRFDLDTDITKYWDSPKDAKVEFSFWNRRLRMPDGSEASSVTYIVSSESYEDRPLEETMWGPPAAIDMMNHFATFPTADGKALEISTCRPLSPKVKAAIADAGLVSFCRVYEEPSNV